MKNCLLLFLFSFLFSCAKMGVISGGDKDTIPPVLVTSTPPNKTTNVKKKDFYFLFDEVIDTKDIKEKLIVSPYTDTRFEADTKKNYLILSFDSAFKNNVTYIFNFADGIKDITEGNAAKSLKYVFSTGPVIDSLFLTGHTIDPLTNVLKKDVLVGLYDINDSLGLFLNKPLYFDYTDSSGFFKIENIKKGFYSIYAFEDKNTSFKAEPDKEFFGFLSSPVSVGDKNDSLLIPLIKQNLLPIRLVRDRKRGLYYEATYSRYVSNIEIINKKKETPQYSLNDNNKTLRFYPSILFLKEDSVLKDSLLVVVKASDSLMNVTVDSLYVSFADSKRPKQEFKVYGFPSSNSILEDSIYFNLRFTKPVLFFNDSFLVNKIDTLYKKGLEINKPTWNKNKTELRFSFLYNKDSLVEWKQEKIKNLKKDSLFYSSDSLYSRDYNYLEKINVDKILFVAEKGSFVSIEKDTLKENSVLFSFKDAGFYGKVSGNIKTKHKSFFIQLVSESFKNILKNKSSKKNYFLFENVPPGTYYVRVLIDENENLVWDKGNIIKNEVPEKTFFLDVSLEVRSNWEIDNINIVF